jgi:hypothetical protein
VGGFQFVIGSNPEIIERVTSVGRRDTDRVLSQAILAERNGCPSDRLAIGIEHSACDASYARLRRLRNQHT